MARQRRLRIGRFSEPNRIYLITAVCRRRHPVFADFTNARCVVRALMAVATSAQTLCYVVMPDHLHWLMTLQPGADMSATVQKVKSQASREIRRGMGYPARIWQRGFHDHALRREEDLAQVARYVVANPLRAGLAGSVREYSHWDAVWV